MSQIINTRFVDYVIDDRGFLEAEYHTDIRKIGFPDAQGIVIDRTRLVSNGKNLPLLLHGDNARIRFTWKALKYLASPAGTAGLSKAAILLEEGSVRYYVIGALSRYRGNPFPFEPFFNRNEAIDWLLLDSFRN